MTSLKLDLLSIEDDGFHIFTKAFINDQPARLLIDTGASRTVFDAERIKLFFKEKERNFEKIDKLSTGLGTNTMESHTAVLETFSMGNMTFVDYQAVVLNMGHVNQSYEKLGIPQIDGVLGGDILHLLKAVIDYRRKEIRWRER